MVDNAHRISFAAIVRDETLISFKEGGWHLLSKSLAVFTVAARGD
jgi:hypothetical protein